MPADSTSGSYPCQPCYCWRQLDDFQPEILDQVDNIDKLAPS